MPDQNPRDHLSYASAFLFWAISPSQGLCPGIKSLPDKFASRAHRHKEKQSMETQTFASKEVKSEFLRVLEQTKEFYLNNPTSDLKTWIFLTCEGEIGRLDRESDDSLTAFPVRTP